MKVNVTALPRLKRKMAKNKLVTINLKSFVVLNGVKVKRPISLFSSSFTIVITDDQMFETIKSPKNFFCLIRLAEGEVTEEPDDVSVINTTVPVLDKHLVHVIDIPVRPTTELDDVVVVEVGVGSEVGGHQRNNPMTAVFSKNQHHAKMNLFAFQSIRISCPM
jgi:hypothetical protein